jgi:transcriptional regulator with XRE-family HTH domain
MSTPAILKTRDTLFARSIARPGVNPLPDKRTAAEIGARVALLRKEKGITQRELAELLEVSQPMVSDYERGELRLHGELILQLTEILGVSADAILGIEKHEKRDGSIKNRKLLRQVQALDRLSKRDQQALLRTIDLFLSKAG